MIVLVLDKYNKIYLTVVEMFYVRHCCGSYATAPPTLPPLGATPLDFYEAKPNSLCEFVKNISQRYFTTPVHG